MWHRKMLQVSKMGILVALLTPLQSQALECPRMPEQSRKDWEVEVKAAVGKIGPVKGAELETATRTATRDLMGKLPQADKVYLEQMMYATYCSALRDDKTLSESEKALRIRAYNLEVRKTLYGPQGKEGRDKQGPTGPGAARLELSQMSLAYTPEAFVETVRKGDSYAVRLFLTAGMDPNARDRHGKPALMHAVSEGHTQIVEALLKAKADVNAEWNGETVVSWKAAQGNVDTLRVWLDRGANAKTINRAFVIAASYGHRQVMLFLLARGADVNKVGPEALEKAVRAARPDSETREREQIDTARFLLDLGVDVNTRADGWTPLTMASASGSTAMVRALLEWGADPNLKCACSSCNPWGGAWGCTALMMAANQGRREMVSVLLSKGANVNEKSDEGYTALMLSRDPEITRTLLNTGTDVNTRDREGKTALMWAIDRFNSDDIVRALLERGADVDVKDDSGRTALTWAAARGWEEMVRTLLNKGVEVNPKTVRGRTPLMLAAMNGYPGVVRALLERGAHLNEKDVTGKTALQLAQERVSGETKDEIVHLLQQAGAK